MTEVQSTIGLVAIPKTCHVPGAALIVALFCAQNLHPQSRKTSRHVERNACVEPGDKELIGTQLSDQRSPMMVRCPRRSAAIRLRKSKANRSLPRTKIELPCCCPRRFYGRLELTFVVELRDLTTHRCK